MITLPEAYIKRMQDMLGDRAEDFFASYQDARTQGLRINPKKLKASDPNLSNLAAAFQLEPVPWCSTGYYYAEGTRPGKHPYHAAGLYYIQEPSAMSVVELLDPKPGEIVLDLAAAPGGKSTQIAGKLQGKGLLIANEIHPGRAKILSENIERMGVINAIVTQCTPDQLAAKFPSFFDKIMLDAPCSGEGMFRKDPEAIEEWSPEHVTMCALRQMDIVRQAVAMLKPGGILAYSTCTFSREENEELLDAMVGEFPEMRVLQTERIWPHLHRGEGHFAAIIQKRDGEEIKKGKSGSKPSRNANKANEPFRSFQDWLTELYGSAGSTVAALEQWFGIEMTNGEPLLYGEQLYWLPHGGKCDMDNSRLEGLRVLRPGLHLATVKKNRIEPAHALALAMPSAGNLPKDVQWNVYSVPADSTEALAYLRGETLPSSESTNGWRLIAVDGYPFGWGKVSDGQIKNHYPKGLRWLG